MNRSDDCFLLTQVDKIIGFSCEGLKLGVYISVGYDEHNMDFYEYIKIPKYAVLMREDKLDIMVLEKVENIDMELMKLVYECYGNIKLNEEGKQYYNMLCTKLKNNETDENWINIYKFVEEYCILEVTTE